jgi:hypothetical protein
VIAALLPCAAIAQQRKTANVILVTTDGRRWQEFFSGAERADQRRARCEE